MNDLISRQAAINTAFTMRCRCDTNDIDDYANMILAALEVLPTIEPKCGKWISNSPFTGNCSECGGSGNLKDNYCPNCGAKMIEEECEDEDWYTELDDPKIAERSEEC